MTEPQERIVPPESSARREFLKAAAVGSLGVLPVFDAAAAEDARAGERQRNVRDALWVWTHVAGAHNRGWNIPRPSRMTPLEGAVYLGVPNLLFIRYEDEPALPFDPYAVCFRPMKQVVWSLTGASGRTSEEERDHVLGLAARFPNVTGFVMDDFFRGSGEGALAPEELKVLRDKLVINKCRRPLCVVVYDHQLELPLAAHLEFCDTITFWTWTADKLDQLEKNFTRLEQIAPTHGKLLGCYLWDYGRKQPMSVERMQRQCALGLEWLRSGRIEGMIFLASNICDLELPAVEFTRRWIAEVGGQAL